MAATNDPREPKVPPVVPPEVVPPVSAEALVGDQVMEDFGDQGEPRRYPSTIGGALYLVVLAVALVGLVLAWTGDWRVGVQVLAASLWGAALGRVVLPERDAGMLAVRNRWLDALMLVGLGVALTFLAWTIPDRV